MVDNNNISSYTNTCINGITANSNIVSYNFPDNNPNPVMLFNNLLELVYNNQAAANDFLNFCTTDELYRFNITLNQIYVSIANSKKTSSHFYFSTLSKHFKFNIVFNDIDNVLYVYGIDITREKSLSDEVNRQAELLARVLDSIPADIVMFNTKHQYTYINQTAINNEQVRNWLLGKTDFDYCSYKGIDTKLAVIRRQYFNKALRTKSTVDYVDKVKKDNGYVYVLRRFEPVVKKGKVQEVIGYGVDITSQQHAKKNLIKVYEMLFNNQVLLKQILSHYVHNVRLPMANIEGLVEIFNLENPADPDNKVAIEGIIKSYAELQNNLKGLTSRLDDSFNTFKADKKNLDIKTSVIEIAESVMFKYSVKFKLRFSSAVVSNMHYYSFMFNRIFKQFFKYLALEIDKEVLNINVDYCETEYYNILQLSINNIYLSNSKILNIKESLKSINMLDYNINKNNISDIACILSCSGGDLSFTYNAQRLSFNMSFPKLQIN
jgi:PAS domain-containing protein